MELGVVLVKMEQELFELIAGLFGVSAPAEAVPEPPCVTVKGRILPLQALNSTIA